MGASIRDVPCLSCQHGYGGVHQCDVPDYCPCDQPDRHVSGNGKPVYSDGHVHVMAEMCSTCVFRPGNLMSLQPGRLKEMVDGAIAGGSVITCHKTIYGQAEQEAACRGYVDRYAQRVPALRLAAAMGIIEEVGTEHEPE